MSIIRAFTQTRNKPDLEISSPTFLGRAASQRGGRPVMRTQISSPRALVSTSNMHVHNALQILGTSPIEIRNVSSSSSSGEDSDTGSGSIHSSDTITDASSIDTSPVSPEPGPNHLSCYFKPAVDTHTRNTSQPSSTSDSPSSDLTPKIPQRVPSHSKKAHESLHRKRSLQRVLSPPPSRSGSHRVARSSTEMFRSPFVEAPKENPFGKELEQLEQVREEFGQVVQDAEAQADVVSMESHGLAHYAASEYMLEIRSLIHDMFSDERPAVKGFGFF